MMSVYVYNLDFFNFYLHWNLEDILVVFLLYSFFKYLIICSIVELIWPTQYFNRKNNIGTQIIRFRVYTEVLLKLRNFSTFFYIFNVILLKNFFF